MPRIALVTAIALAGCSPAEPPLMIDPSNQPTTVAGHEPQTPVEKVRAAVRAEANRLYADECGAVQLPDRAFEPIEITGGGHPEYAVLFGRGICVGDGSSGRWQGTGGSMVQIWLASGGPPRMLIEHSMHGFSVGPRSMTSLQHGGFCPGGAGPGSCLVQYEWNERDRTLEVVHRRYFDGAQRLQPPRMAYDYHAISR